MHGTHARTALASPRNALFALWKRTSCPCLPNPWPVWPGFALGPSLFRIARRIPGPRNGPLVFQLLVPNEDRGHGIRTERGARGWEPRFFDRAFMHPLHFLSCPLPFSLSSPCPLVLPYPSPASSLAHPPHPYPQPHQTNRHTSLKRPGHHRGKQASLPPTRGQPTNHTPTTNHVGRQVALPQEDQAGGKSTRLILSPCFKSQARHPHSSSPPPPHKVKAKAEPVKP